MSCNKCGRENVNFMCAGCALDEYRDPEQNQADDDRESIDFSKFGDCDGEEDGDD